MWEGYTVVGHDPKAGMPMVLMGPIDEQEIAEHYLVQCERLNPGAAFALVEWRAGLIESVVGEI